MKTFDERRKSVENHIKKIQTRRRRGIAAVTAMSLVVGVLAMVLFIPFSTTPPDVTRYAGSDYYTLIQRLNDITFQKPAYKNNFEKLADSLDFGVKASPYPGGELTILGTVAGMNSAVQAPMEGPLYNVPDGNKSDVTAGSPDLGEQYEEVTDNQVAGVIEADIFKRSDQYVYYLRGTVLSVYSIAGEDSRLVGTYAIDPFPQEDKAQWGDFSYSSGVEMYLSQDCKTVTLVLSGYGKVLGACTVLINLDVSDPDVITETGKVYFTGNYVSSRMVGGHILLTYNYKVNISDIDFDDVSTFVPQYGTPENMTCIPAEQIVCPDTISDTRYTAVCKVNGGTLAIEGSTALLSYSEELYVSEDTIYATHSYSAKLENSEEKKWKQTTMTEITGISYAADSLQILGTIALEGTLKDQYSMDQYNGILRVVASTSARTYTETAFGDEVYVSSSGLIRNVNLYCVDLSDWTVAASVIAFAPDGEDAQSVRFDGYNAYVCTAQVITLTDPVYFFDLSDLSNITWKDTGTIDGYSTSLINLSDGYLLGIGYSENRTLKIEVYEQTADGVAAVDAFESEASFSEDYKSYLVDRENNLVGLHILYSSRGEALYVLFHFNGYMLVPLAEIPVSGNVGLTRAFISDGWLYVLTSDSGNNFFVTPIA